MQPWKRNGEVNPVWIFRVLITLDLLCLLVAYAAGSHGSLRTFALGVTNGLAIFGWRTVASITFKEYPQPSDVHHYPLT